MANVVRLGLTWSGIDVVNAVTARLRKVRAGSAILDKRLRKSKSTDAGDLGDLAMAAIWSRIVLVSA